MSAKTSQKDLLKKSLQEVTVKLLDDANRKRT